MGHRNKFNIILSVRTKSAHRNRHTAFQISLAFDLRTVVFAEIVDKLLGCAGKIQFLRPAAIAFPFFDDFFHFSLLLKGNEYCCGVAVSNRHADALRGNRRRNGVNDFIIFYMAPDFQRLLLRFLLFAANIGNDVIHHLGPCLKRFASAGDRLIGACQYFSYA